MAKVIVTVQTPITRFTAYRGDETRPGLFFTITVNGDEKTLSNKAALLLIDTMPPIFGSQTLHKILKNLSPKEVVDSLRAMRDLLDDDRAEELEAYLTEQECLNIPLLDVLKELSTRLHTQDEILAAIAAIGNFAILKDDQITFVKHKVVKKTSHEDNYKIRFNIREMRWEIDSEHRCNWDSLKTSREDTAKEIWGQLLASSPHLSE